jgi:hypothetical protein
MENLIELEDRFFELKKLLDETTKQNDAFRKKLYEVQEMTYGKDGELYNVWSTIESLWHE